MPLRMLRTMKIAAPRPRIIAAPRMIAIKRTAVE